MAEGRGPSAAFVPKEALILRACIFVDGENFRNSIVDLFEGFRQEDYLPKDADWEGLFDWVVRQATPGGERLRTYWYVIQSIDYYPYGLSRLSQNPEMAYSVLSNHLPYRSRLDDVEEGERPTVISSLIQELSDRQARMDRRFQGWTAIQEGIASKHAAVEFRRAGAIRFDLFTSGLGKEKAVDVKLATDMILLRDIYDTAIIVSGDQDYVPAVQAIKDSGKRVINASFRTRSGQLLPGGARRLNQVTDDSLAIDFGILSKFLALR